MDAWIEVMTSARRHPLRTGLTLFGVALGSLIIVTLVSLLYGAEAAMERSRQEATGKDVLQIEPSAADDGLAAKVVPSLGEDDARALARHDKLGAADAVASYELPSVQASARAREMRVAVKSGGAAAIRLARLELLHGRWMTPDEERERVCVLGYEVWKRLFEGRWPLDPPYFLLDGSVPFRVVGIAAPRPTLGGGSANATWPLDRKVWVGTSAMRMALEPSPSAPTVSVKPSSADTSESGVRASAKRLRPFVLNRHRGVENFVFTALQEKDALGVLLKNALATLVALAAVVCILAGGVNLLNAQLGYVAQRAGQFAIRRALGMPASAVWREVLTESVLLSALGSAAGCAVGAALSAGACMLLSKLVAPWPYLPVPWAFVVALAVSLIVGILAGMAPARRASRLSVVECLRDS